MGHYCPPAVMVVSKWKVWIMVQKTQAQNTCHRGKNHQDQVQVLLLLRRYTHLSINLYGGIICLFIYLTTSNIFHMYPSIILYLIFSNNDIVHPAPLLRVLCVQ